MTLPHWLGWLQVVVILFRDPGLPWPVIGAIIAGITTIIMGCFRILSG